MATKKTVVKPKGVEDLKTIDDVRAFRLEILRPMERGEERRALRLKLQERAMEIRQAAAVKAEK